MLEILLGVYLGILILFAPSLLGVWIVDTTNPRLSGRERTILSRLFLLSWIWPLVGLYYPLIYHQAIRSYIRAFWCDLIGRNED